MYVSADATICRDCSFVTMDVGATTPELGHPVERVFDYEARQLARAYLKMMAEFNPTNKTLVMIHLNLCKVYNILKFYLLWSFFVRGTHDYIIRPILS